MTYAESMITFTEIAESSIYDVKFQRERLILKKNFKKNDGNSFSKALNALCLNSLI